MSKKIALQREQLLKMPDVAPIKVDVEQLPTNLVALLAKIIHKCEQIHVAGLRSAIFTSRSKKVFSDHAKRLAFGNMVYAFLMEVVRSLQGMLGFLIGKGGITSKMC